jgi:putative restriction endonuclease
MMERRIWTREELLLALNLYLKLPFGKMHRRNSEVIHLGELIDRTPDSVAFRLTNFAHLDPYHQQRGVKGMSGGKKQVKPIWEEFLGNKEKLIFESEKILAEKENTSIEKKFASILTGTENLTGEVKVREVKTRVNQNFFRKIVLVNYRNRCAITGICIPSLLIASHIVPWSESESERLNPENGICLSPLYDRAFDLGYIGINDKMEIILSKELKQFDSNKFYLEHFGKVDNLQIFRPQKYSPRKEFLQYHRDVIFRG